LTGQGSLERAATGVEPLRLVECAPSWYERRLKPTFDRAAAALLLVIFSPLLLTIALLVRVSLGPGVLYRQVRIGQDGEPFSMLKFRTMQPDRRRTADGQLRIDRRLAADRRSGHDRRQVEAAIDGPERRQGSDRRLGERRAPEGSRRRTHKTPNDPRHTRLGRFLRAYSLDELPQLINVLRGELSLVGPRPELPEVVADYEPWQHARHGVKPGITGLWQTTDRANGEPMHLHVDRDLEYIQRVSARTDMSILLLTVPVLLGLSRGNRGS
jgi:lipopolysaccharide/colanic/teichoic acid biosynthesis glycosyltransferase